MKVLSAFFLLVTLCLAAMSLAKDCQTEKSLLFADAAKMQATTNSTQILISNPIYNEELAERRGCCSHHGGVCGCQGGRAICCDGSASPSCGCD